MSCYKHYKLEIMKNVLLLIFITGFFLSGISQTVLYSEDFEGGHDFTLGGGANNDWVVNDEYEGGTILAGLVTIPNVPNQPAGFNNSPESNYLHVLANGAATEGVFNANYLLGFSTDVFDAETTTPFSTVGYEDITINFWRTGGEDGLDLYYKIGAAGAWTQFHTITGNPSTWQQETVVFPAAVENEPDVFFAFRFDEVAADDPAPNHYHGIDEIEVTGMAMASPPPNADFSASQTTICEGDCIDFTENSVGTNISSWDWDFDGGGTPNTSTDQNPNNICFNSEGVYEVELTITDDNGTDTETLTITVNDCSVPNSSFTASETDICEGDCIDFTDNSTGTNVSSWDWNFDGGATPNTSTDQNPSNICFNDEGTYDVSLTITDDNGTNTSTVTITVDDCPSTGPNADFTISNPNPCAGDCIDFTDNSTGNNIINWGWDFGGGATPNNTTDQNPSGICFDTPGTYTITLGVIDADGNDTHTQTLVVDDCSGNIPNSNFDYEGVLCSGNCIDFVDLSTGNIDSWEWDFDGGSPATSIEQNPENICFDSSGVYNVSLTTENSNGTSTFTFSINFNESPQIEAFGDTLIDVGGTAVLGAEIFTFGDIAWEPSESIFCLDDDCLEVEATPNIGTTYTVTITDINGCEGSDQVFVDVDVDDIIGVPSAFSPNNDGLNDELRVLGEGIQSMEFKVYNRYGQLVFETTDQDDGWDGTFKQQRLNQGVFAYTLRYTLIDGTQGEKEGNVTLVK